MSLYTKDSIERVKDAVDMVELVGVRTDLRRVGTRYTGLCPFHDERTPSFSVDAEHKLYHCFGCGESGDAIRYVESTEGLDFKEAVESLAERYNVELRRDREDPRAEELRRRRERLLALLDRTAAYYSRVLWESGEAQPARAYLTDRGLGEGVLREFRVGYAPGAWDRVLLAAQRDGFSPDELIAAGLAQRGRQGGIYDRFRSRIIFPLADPRGRVLGFGARAVRPDQRPKYLNTSETEVYHKGRQLFGIDRARASAAKAGRVVAVEGYTDVLALHQAGVPETVAIMGTALTQEQLAELGRAAGTVYLALDADSAGQEAMLRAARSARERDLELLVVSLPNGKDPAELVTAEGPDAFIRRLDGALSVPEFEARRVLAAADLRNARGRDRALEQVLPLVASLPQKSATRDDLVRYLADRLNVPGDYLVTHIQTQSPKGPALTATARVNRPAIVEQLALPERAFLVMCLSRPDVGLEHLERLEIDHFTSDGLRRVRDHLVAHWSDPLADLPEDDPSLAGLIRDVVMRSGRDDVSAEDLRVDFLKLERSRVDRQLRRAQLDGDLEAQRLLQRARHELKDKYDELIGMVQ